MKKLLEKIHTPVWLTLFLAIILILRIPSFFEPYSYGDEMIYLTLGQGIRQGIHLYSGIFDNKPPFLYLLAALAGNLFWFKAILAFWNLITIILFWNLAKIIFPAKEKLHQVATIIFGLLTTLPLLEGNIVNAELFMIGPIIVAFIILFSQKQKGRNLFISGLFFSIATLFKIPAAFDLPVIIAFWIIYLGLRKEKPRQIIQKSFYLVAGFLLPIFLTLVFFYFQGSFKEYFTSVFLQNVGYLSSFRPGDIQKPFLVRNLPLILRATVVALGVFILFLKRKSLSKEFVFVTIWLLLGLFAITLSERPYPHYLIQIAAPLSFLLGIFFTEKSLEQSFSIIPLFLAVFVPVYYCFWFYPTSSYYVRFAKFITGKINQKEYFLSFGKNVPRTYDLANFLASSSTKKQRVFVVGDSPAIYALSKRLPTTQYVADYHISDFSSMEKEADKMNKNKPDYIIILPETRNYLAISPLLRSSYYFVEGIDGSEVWRLANFPLRK